VTEEMTPWLPWQPLESYLGFSCNNRLLFVRQALSSKQQFLKIEELKYCEIYAEAEETVEIQA